jgi:hypothetical protein
MAIPQHLDVLKQGVRVWNEWREENPGADAKQTSKGPI